MDSWIYNGMSSGKNVFLSEEVDYPVEDHNCKSKLTPNSNIENYPLISNTQALDRLDFMDLGFTDDIRKSYSISSEPSGEVFSDEISTDYHHQERESSEFNQSNNQDFSLVDLKLGSLADCGIAMSSELSKTDVLESSMMCSNPGKKARQTTSFGVRSTVCQVLGCNKDLGCFKSYYKRHKVCDVHTKTPKVVVDGVEQRFCQQCSRFHLLNEFDDIKRSCRRRLAAHNKRRRRPQLTAEPGSGIIDFSSSLSFPEEMPNVFLTSSSSKYEASEDSLKSSNFLPQMDKIPPNNNTNNSNNLFPPIQNSTTSSIQHHNSRARALSLLSAQSQSSSHNADSIIIHSAGTSEGISQSGPHPPRIYSGEGPTGTTLNPSNGGRSDCVHPKGRGVMLNLMQLSSHLERVENQRQYSTENEAG